MKIIIRIILLLSAFLLTAPQVFAESPRVQCSNMTITITMSVPSASAKCLTVMSSESAAEGKSLTEAKIASASIYINDYFKSGKLNPEVTVYSINALSSVNSEIYAAVTNLTNLMNQVNSSGGTVSVTTPVPFLPYQEKTQLVAVLPSVVNFSNGTGLRTITAYGDSGAAVSNDNLVYTIQGITLDGTKYLSAVIPIINSQITGTIDAATFNWNSLPAESWSPSLSVLDAYMQSIIIN
ncbi:MAG: hypothetical protein AB9907_03970 [Flexilinea sp.]